jgi:hypothetical protein
MTENVASLRDAEKTYCEKLVWQGEYAGINIRVRIVQSDRDSPIETLVEKYCTCTDGVQRWFEYMGWHLAGADECSIFVEAMIDLMGRPDWDTRPRTTSVYPYKLIVQVCEGDNGAGG